MRSREGTWGAGRGTADAELISKFYVRLQRETVLAALLLSRSSRPLAAPSVAFFSGGIGIIDNLFISIDAVEAWRATPPDRFLRAEEALAGTPAGSSWATTTMTTLSTPTPQCRRSSLAIAPPSRRPPTKTCGSKRKVMGTRGRWRTPIRGGCTGCRTIKADVRVHGLGRRWARRLRGSSPPGTQGFLRASAGQARTPPPKGAPTLQLILSSSGGGRPVTASPTPAASRRGAATAATGVMVGTLGHFCG